jgi:disulfide bond formation protein DsbB
VEPPGTEAIDPQADRAAQSIVGVALLAAFVFRMPWLLPVVAVVALAGALGGAERNLLYLGYDRLVAPRLRTPAPTPALSAVMVRRQDALAAGLVSVASVLYVFGAHTIGWAVAILEAVIAVVAATTRIHVADYVHRPRRGHAS